MTNLNLTDLTATEMQELNGGVLTEAVVALAIAIAGAFAAGYQAGAAAAQ